MRKWKLKVKVVKQKKKKIAQLYLL